MPYHIDEENSELVFEVTEEKKLIIKLKSNTGGGGSDIYLIKTGDETTPTEKNTFSSLRILKEIEQLHETILQEVGSDLSVWEIKQAENGEKYISTKYDVVTEKGITAYASGIQDVGSIVDGIPFDNKTIWYNEETGVVEVIGGTGGSEFDSSKMWDLLLSDTDEQINISHLADALSGYATEEELRKKWTQDDNKISNWDDAYSWGNHANAGYAKQTSLDAVSSKLNDFLEGSDTDTIINKWKELEAFLSGMTESDNLADILSNKADKSFVTSELTKYVTLTTSQTISGAKTFTSLLTTAAIKAKGDINTPNVRTSDSVYINGVRVYKPQDKVLKIEGNLLVTGGITQYSIDSGDYPNIEDIVSDSIKVDNISVKKDNGIIKSCSLNLSGYYTGGEEKPINLGGAMFKVTMLRNTTMGLSSDSYWNDVIWISSYGGSDVANSQILAFSKNGMKRIYHARQSFSSGSYGGFDAIAYISDTVAAATKLETSRMIFGQSFDGTQDIDGDITTSGSLLNGSDARNKNILDTINCISLDNIVSLPIIKFRWNNRTFKDDGRTRYGTIAQEVQKILPELVYDRDNSLYMDYAVAGTIFSISVAKSLKGTKSEVERLKERVRILEEMLNIKQNGNEESDTLAN